MSRVWQSPDRRERMIAAKGAPEAIVDLCHLDAAQRQAIADQVSAMAGEGLRVLGVARAVFEAEVLARQPARLRVRIPRAGRAGRPGAARSAAGRSPSATSAGIRVVMMTGDHPATALSVARQVGLGQTRRAVITGAELAGLSDDDLRARLADTHIFCRVQPEQKLRLVQAFRARGEVVAMTGDGVNDAPALKAAHIGVAMGARGTDVAREAAALVLLNDDFASIVTAVRYGRRVFANLRKAIVFVVAVHVPIVGLSIVPVLLGWPMLLMPVHILFLQLIIDPACSVVFEAEPLEADAMTAPAARSRAAPVRCAGSRARPVAGRRAAGAAAGGVRGRALGITSSDDTARALTFMVLVLSNLGLIHANRSWGAQWRWRGAGASNRYLRLDRAGHAGLAGLRARAFPAISRLFAFAAPTPVMLLAGAGVALMGLLWFEGVKRMSTGRRT